MVTKAKAKPLKNPPGPPLVLNPWAVRNLIQRAEKGERDCAWHLIEKLATTLAASTTYPDLHGYASKFFERLLDLYEEGRDTPSGLMAAFDTLHVVRERGRPGPSEDETAKLAARVILILRAGYCLNDALNALGSVDFDEEGRYRESAYKIAYGQSDLGKALRKVPLAELESAANIASSDLIAALLVDGGLLESKRQSNISEDFLE
jgi:hypothetical protein